MWQPSAQLSAQPFSQLPEHDELHEPEQLFPHPEGVFLSEHEVNNDVPKTTTPRTGRAALAASLKNSRRDWSSSFFFELDIKT